MNLSKGFLALLIIVSLWDSCLSQDGPVIETTYGPVRGANKLSSNGIPYEEYLGIQYGAPPVGDARWRKPSPPEVWTEVRNTTSYPPHCIQFVAAGYPAIGFSNETSEDCLYLNVYVPGEDRVGDGLAVMVWIYGGAWFLGTAAMYPAQDLATFGDVIVVQMNFRVGSIGFLSTEDEAAPGNWGLWDIQLALQWVQENIAAFGGDPNSVTVFGQSAGGAATSHMLVTPTTEGLFHRGIAISGSSSGFFGVGLPGAVAESTQTLALTVGCRRTNSSEELVDCLREVDANEIDFWGFFSVVTLRQQLPNFMPVIDGDFVPQHPSRSWTEGAAANRDVITGFCRHDAAGFVTANPLGLPNNTVNFAGTNATLQLFLAFIMAHYPNGGDGRKAMFEQYPLMEEEDEETRTIATTDACTDWWFSSSSHYEALEHHRSKDTARGTYHYRFFYDQSFLEYPQEWIAGSHLDDIYSVLGERFLEEMRENFMNGDGQFNDTDRLVSRNVMSYYVNFAKSGDPNVGLAVPEPWPQYDETDRQFLDINAAPTIRQESQEQLDNYQFWNEEFPNIVLNDNPLFAPRPDDIDWDDDDDITRAILEAYPLVVELLCGLVPDGCDLIQEQADIYLARRDERRQEWVL